MLGIGGLSKLGEEYVSEYWDETVVATEAKRVLLVHHDDYTAPFGEVAPVSFDCRRRCHNGWLDKNVK